MQKNAMTVGETTLVNTEKGSMSNEQVINFDDLKEAWKEFAEHSYEDSRSVVEDYLGDGVDDLDAGAARVYLDEAEAAQDLSLEIDSCNNMEDYKAIDFKRYLLDMGFYSPLDAQIISYAVNECGIDEKVAEVMSNVFKNK